MNFNKEQIDIINNLEGAFLVSAPVGTGKTTVLTERVVKAIEEGIEPASILCLTFTNRAAEEMKSRIKTRLNNLDKYSDLTISTFHGFCAKFLREEAKEVGLAHDFVIADDMEQVEILNRILANHPKILELELNRADILEKFYKNRLYNIYFRYNFISAKPAELPAPWSEIMGDYYQALHSANAVDFNELVILTINALYENANVSKRWQNRFKFVELDEFQDTHLSEYLVIKELAKQCKNITLVGDLDQTIYSWRGSQPQKIAKLFKSHFGPVTEFALKENYRSDPNLLPLFNKISSDINGEYNVENIINSNIEVKEYYNNEEEINSLTAKIKDLKKTEPKAKVAVLLRNNYQVNKIAEILALNNIEHITVDQYNFFRRQEVRDAFAWLKIIFNKLDLESIRRVVERPGKKIDKKIVEQVNAEGKHIGFKMSDFLNFSNYRQSEPFADLLAVLKNGRAVVIDTETTGVDISKDEIVQAFAMEIINGKIGERKEWLLKNNKPVGSSYHIHRLTDDYLAENGQEPKKALEEFINFIGSDIVIGHNVNFDLSILEENAGRAGLKFVNTKYYDTLDIARRYVEAPNYKLETLSRLLNVHQASHNAEDDVLACWDLLDYLKNDLAAGANSRAKLFSAFSKNFISLASDLARWQLIAKVKRPAELLEDILNESGLIDYYSQDANAEKRLKSLAVLKRLFADLDEKDLSPKESLLKILSYGSLVKNIDFLGLDEGKVPIVTIHQVKGLEFDYVFMPFLNEGSFPSRHKNVDIEEEKRVFYVGVTRAKKSLYLSYSQFNNYGYSQAKSQFLAYF